MTVSLFIRTYEKDAGWLRYCLRSLERHGSGFSQRIIVTPVESDGVIGPIAREFGWLYDVCERMAGDDYVGQQGTKMMADMWCSGDVICYVDSDLVFSRSFTPECVVEADGRIPMLKTRYDGIECPWRPITEGVVGFPVEWEYMRRFPLAYPRELLPLARARIEEVHGIGFGEFIRRVPGRHLSEFNVLGAVGEREMPERFRMIDTDGGGEWPPLYAKQFWSWGGITPEIADEMEGMIGHED